MTDDDTNDFLNEIKLDKRYLTGDALKKREQEDRERINKNYRKNSPIWAALRAEEKADSIERVDRAIAASQDYSDLENTLENRDYISRLSPKERSVVHEQADNLREQDILTQYQHEYLTDATRNKDGMTVREAADVTYNGRMPTELVQNMSNKDPDFDFLEWKKENPIPTAMQAAIDRENIIIQNEKSARQLATFYRTADQAERVLGNADFLEGTGHSVRAWFDNTDNLIITAALIIASPFLAGIAPGAGATAAIGRVGVWAAEGAVEAYLSERARAGGMRIEGNVEGETKFGALIGGGLGAFGQIFKHFRRVNRTLADSHAGLPLTQEQSAEMKQVAKGLGLDPDASAAEIVEVSMNKINADESLVVDSLQNSDDVLPTGPDSLLDGDDVIPLNPNALSTPLAQAKKEKFAARLKQINRGEAERGFTGLRNAEQRLKQDRLKVARELAEAEPVIVRETVKPDPRKAGIEFWESTYEPVPPPRSPKHPMFSGSSDPLWDFPFQSIRSDTSARILSGEGIPKTFTYLISKGLFKQASINLDIGGGPYNNVNKAMQPQKPIVLTNEMDGSVMVINRALGETRPFPEGWTRPRGEMIDGEFQETVSSAFVPEGPKQPWLGFPTNIVYDPFNRSISHNRKVVGLAADGGVNSATIVNTLNVVPDEAGQLKILRQAKNAVEKDGSIYISVYEGNKSGVAKVTKSGYQANKVLYDYLPLIKTVFPNAFLKGKIIYIVNKNGLAPIDINPLNVPVVYKNNLISRSGSKGKVSVQTDRARNRILVDKEEAKASFEAKAWTSPKVEGVLPYPENAFRSVEQWIDFLIAHERAHLSLKNMKVPKGFKRENHANRVAYEEVVGNSSRVKVSPKKVISHFNEKMEEAIESGSNPSTNPADHIDDLADDIADMSVSGGFSPPDTKPLSAATAPTNSAGITNPSAIESLYSLGLPGMFGFLSKIRPSKLSLFDHSSIPVTQSGITVQSERRALIGHFYEFERVLKEILKANSMKAHEFRKVFNEHMLALNSEVAFKNAAIREAELALKASPNDKVLQEALDIATSIPIRTLSTDSGINALTTAYRKYFKLMNDARVLALRKSGHTVTPNSFFDEVGYSPLNWDLIAVRELWESDPILLRERLKSAYLNSPESLALKASRYSEYEKLIDGADKNIDGFITGLMDSTDQITSSLDYGFGSSRNISRVLDFERSQLSGLVGEDFIASATRYAYEMPNKLSAQSTLGVSSRSQFDAKYTNSLHKEINEAGYNSVKKKLIKFKLDRIVDDIFGIGRTANNPEALIQQSKKFVTSIQIIRFVANFGLVQAGEIPQAIKLSPSFSQYVSNMSKGLVRTFKEYKGSTGDLTPDSELFNMLQNMGQGMTLDNSMSARLGIDDLNVGKKGKPTPINSGLEWLRNKGLHWSGMMGLLQTTRHAATLGFMQSVLGHSRSGIPLKKGLLGGGELTFYTRQGISDELLERIKGQPWTSNGRKWQYNYDKWDEDVLKDFLDSTSRASREAIANPEAIDLPKFMSNPENVIGNQAALYLKFPTEVYNTILKNGITDRDARTLISWTQSLLIIASVYKAQAIVSEKVFGTKDPYQGEDGWYDLVVKSLKRLPAGSLGPTFFAIFQALKGSLTGAVYTISGAGNQFYFDLWETMYHALDGENAKAMMTAMPLIPKPVSGGIPSSRGIPLAVDAMDEVNSLFDGPNAVYNSASETISDAVGAATSGVTGMAGEMIAPGPKSLTPSDSSLRNIPSAPPLDMDRIKGDVGSTTTDTPVDNEVPSTEVGTSGVVPDATGVSNVGSHTVKEGVVMSDSLSSYAKKLNGLLAKVGHIGNINVSSGVRTPKEDVEARFINIRDNTKQDSLNTYDKFIDKFINQFHKEGGLGVEKAEKNLLKNLEGTTGAHVKENYERLQKQAFDISVTKDIAKDKALLAKIKALDVGWIKSADLENPGKGNSHIHIEVDLKALEEEASPDDALSDSFKTVGKDILDSLVGTAHAGEAATEVGTSGVVPDVTSNIYTSKISTELGLEKSAHKEIMKFADLVAKIESQSGVKRLLGKAYDTEAVNKGSGAAGAFQFKSDSVLPALNRMTRFGKKLPVWASKLRVLYKKGKVSKKKHIEVITALTYKQQRDMFLADISQKTISIGGKKKPGYGNKLLKLISEGNRQAFYDLYIYGHHTDPDQEGTASRAKEIFELKEWLEKNNGK